MMSKNPTFTIETITPEGALEYACMSAGNRAIRDNHVAMLAGQMTRGEWMINNNAITFDHDGHLIDGHHRLLAVSAAGCAVRMSVIRGVDPKARDTIDIGPSRTLSDHLRFNKVDNYTQRAGMITACVRIVVGTSVAVKNYEAYAQWAPHFEKGTAAFFALGCASSKHMRTAKCSAPLIIAHKANPEKMEAFFIALRDGANLSPNHPALRLRESLLLEMAGDARRKTSHEDTVSRVFAASKAFIEGRTLSKVQVSDTAVDYFRSLYSRGNVGKQLADVRGVRGVVRSLTSSIDFDPARGGVSEELRNLPGKDIQRVLAVKPRIRKAGAV